MLLGKPFWANSFQPKLKLGPGLLVQSDLDTFTVFGRADSESFIFWFPSNFSKRFFSLPKYVALNKMWASEKWIGKMKDFFWDLNRVVFIFSTKNKFSNLFLIRVSTYFY